MLRTSILTPNCHQQISRSQEDHPNSSVSSKDFINMQQEQPQQQPVGTPNDVRLLFPMMMMQRRESCPSTVSSPSIPIAPSERSESEIQLEDDEAKAEFREHAMFQRIFYGIRENKKQQPSAIPSFHQAVSLPYFPALPTAIALHDHEAAANPAFHYEPKVQPLPSVHAAVPRLVTWHDMQQQLGHPNNMIGREFILATTNHDDHNSGGPESFSDSSCCNDEDFVFEMDM